MQRMAYGGFGQRYEFGHLRGVRVDRSPCRLNGRSGELNLAIHLGSSMLQRLKRADGLTKLPPNLEVFKGDIECLRGHTEHFSSESSANAIENLIQERAALID